MSLTVYFFFLEAEILELKIFIPSWWRHRQWLQIWQILTVFPLTAILTCSGWSEEKLRGSGAQDPSGPAQAAQAAHAAQAAQAVRLFLSPLSPGPLAAGSCAVQGTATIRTWTIILGQEDCGARHHTSRYEIPIKLSNNYYQKRTFVTQ